jgi:hypothetical protein
VQYELCKHIHDETSKKEQVHRVQSFTFLLFLQAAFALRDRNDPQITRNNN